MWRLRQLSPFSCILMSKKLALSLLRTVLVITLSQNFKSLGLSLCDIYYDMIWLWYDIWYDMIYDMTWVIWYDMIWYGQFIYRRVLKRYNVLMLIKANLLKQIKERKHYYMINKIWLQIQQFFHLQLSYTLYKHLQLHLFPFHNFMCSLNSDRVLALFISVGKEDLKGNRYTLYFQCLII